MLDNSEFSKLLTQQLEDIIESKDKIMRENLKIIEGDYKRFLETSIDTCKSLKRVCLEEKRAATAAHYELLAQIYQQILDNYTLSKSYSIQ